MDVQKRLRKNCFLTANKLRVFVILSLIILQFSCQKGTVSLNDEVLKAFDQKICGGAPSVNYHDCYLSLLEKERLVNGERVVYIPSIEARKYISTLDTTVLNQFWVKRKGSYTEERGSNPTPMYFLGYTDDYLVWLEKYAGTEEGKWISSYLQRYQQMNDISPSSIASFDSTLTRQNLNNDKVRLIALVHHLTLAYNYDVSDE